MSVQFDQPVQATGLVASGPGAGEIADTSIVSGPRTRVALDGTLQDALDRGGWRYAGRLAGFARYTLDVAARPSGSRVEVRVLRYPGGLSRSKGARPTTWSPTGRLSSSGARRSARVGTSTCRHRKREDLQPDCRARRGRAGREPPRGQVPDRLVLLGAGSHPRPGVERSRRPRTVGGAVFLIASRRRAGATTDAQKCPGVRAFGLEPVTRDRFSDLVGLAITRSARAARTARTTCVASTSK